MFNARHGSYVDDVLDKSLNDFVLGDVLISCGYILVQLDEESVAWLYT